MATALEASKTELRPAAGSGHIAGWKRRRSTGYLAFQGFEMQHREGLDDNAEIFFKDMVNEIKRQEETYGIEFDAELAKVFAKESASTYDWLVELGFEFNRFCQDHFSTLSIEWSTSQTPACSQKFSPMS